MVTEVVVALTMVRGVMMPGVGGARLSVVTTTLVAGPGLPTQSMPRTQRTLRALAASPVNESDAGWPATMAAPFRLAASAIASWYPWKLLAGAVASEAGVAMGTLMPVAVVKPGCAPAGTTGAPSTSAPGASASTHWMLPVLPEPLAGTVADG